jgi:hypothetical protein
MSRRGDFETFWLNALPMGICISPAWAQHLSLFLVEITHQRLPNIDFDIVVWIDNFILLTNSSNDDMTARNALDQVFSEVNLRTKPWCGGSQHLDVLGISFDLTQRICHPTKEKRASTLALCRELGNRICSNRIFLRWSEWHCGSATRQPAPRCVLSR